MFALEKRIAELAVTRASRLAAAVHVPETVTKDDKSPVTVADFGAQAVIIAAIKKAFPEDKIVGEESAEALRKDHTLCQHVWKLVQDASQDDAVQEIGALAKPEEMLDAIDAGNYAGGNVGRMWALDPIDGTKGFLRKGQYAVCLALIIDGSVVLGTIGCPNLPVTGFADATGPRGVLFSAVKGHGAYQKELTGSANWKPIHFNALKSFSHASFCESVESGHSDQSTNQKIADALGIKSAPVRMDSQAKYCSISRGDGDIYLRLPVSASYEEKIWDHAAGNVIVSEAGGTVTDMYGKPLDFGVGRTLKNNKGVVAASKAIHSDVLAAVKSTVAKD